MKSLFGYGHFNKKKISIAMKEYEKAKSQKLIKKCCEYDNNICISFILRKLIQK
jgi:hypothetical protein